MAKRDTCLICLESKFMLPCGALTDCNVLVCYSCKMDNDSITNHSEGLMDYDKFICIICKKIEYKLGVRWQYTDICYNDWGVVDEDKVKPVIENILFEVVKEYGSGN
tara:strand:- start:236 stop:556 length:321 start_codon:yes stop_codon:yes gene_type:complete